MAKLKYTFSDYIANPSGKGSAVNSMASNSEPYEKELMSLESRNDRVTYKVYRQTKAGGKQVYYIHFLIPSSTKGFFNDTVIEFTQNEDDTSSIRNIKKYNVKFFSNDTNFVYTYAYTFKSHGVLIPELEKHLPFRSLVQKPTMRNPDNAMGYNKSIYYAYIVMNRDNLFDKDTLNRLVSSGGITKLISSIDSFDNKQKERNKITKEAKEAGKKEEKSSKIIKSKNLMGDSNPIESLAPKITKIVGKTKKTSTTKKIKKR